MAQPTRAYDLISDLLAAGMTHGQIAKRTGLSRSYISLLRVGDRGQRIGYAAYAALQGLADASRPDTQPDPSAACQPAVPTRWTPPRE